MFTVYYRCVYCGHCGEKDSLLNWSKLTIIVKNPCRCVGQNTDSSHVDFQPKDLQSSAVQWSYPVIWDVFFISEEEAQQVQEKMDALRIRCSVLSLSSLDVLQRLEQAMEASSRCTSSQEDLHLWLGRIERELVGAAGAGAQTHAGDAVLCAAERQRVSRVPTQHSQRL